MTLFCYDLLETDESDVPCNTLQYTGIWEKLDAAVCPLGMDPRAVVSTTGPPKSLLTTVIQLLIKVTHTKAGLVSN